MEKKLGYLEVKSHYFDNRYDYVYVFWSDIEKVLNLSRNDQEYLILRNNDGSNIDFQIDRALPDNSSRDIIIFKSSPGSSVSIYKSDNKMSEKQCEVINFLGYRQDQNFGDNLVTSEYSVFRGIEFSNQHIKVWFALSQLDNGLIGCATSFVLNSKPSYCKEMLDFWEPNCINHNPQKQFMKINKVVIPSSPWKLSDIDMQDVGYQIVYHHIGPVRGLLTLKSTPLLIPAEVTSKKVKEYSGHLYRFISIYPDQNWIMDELSFTIDCDGTGRYVFFSTWYYMSCDFREPSTLYRYDGITGWFALGNGQWDPFPSYGFTTSAHAERPAILDFGEDQNPTKYQWKLGLRNNIRNIHVFNVRTYCDDCIGRLWFTQILDALTVNVIKGERYG